MSDGTARDEVRLGHARRSSCLRLGGRPPHEPLCVCVCVSMRMRICAERRVSACKRQLKQRAVWPARLNAAQSTTATQLLGLLYSSLRVRRAWRLSTQSATHYQSTLTKMASARPEATLAAAPRVVTLNWRSKARVCAARHGLSWPTHSTHTAGSRTGHRYVRIY